jgi:hypothetical protein
MLHAKLKEAIRISMKTLLWVFLIAGLTAFAGWVVIGPWYPKDPKIIFLLVLYFGVPNIGALWVWYVSLRYEKHPMGFVLLALIPYFFLWYYFERVRLGKHQSRQPLNATSAPVK